MAVESTLANAEAARHENPFDRVTALAATLFQAPVSAVSLIEGDCYVLTSAKGMVKKQGAKSDTFSQHALALGPHAVLVIEDALADPRTRDNPYVLGPPNARFYAGAVITSADGRNLGTVAVADTAPRTRPDDASLHSLGMLARIAADICEKMEASRLQDERLQKLELAETMAGVGHFRLDAASGRISWSDEVYRIHGLEPGSVDPTLHTAIGAYHPDDVVTIRGLVEHALKTGEGYEAQLRLTRTDGEARITRAKARCERDALGTVTALFGVFQDVTESVRAQDRLRTSEAGYRLLADNATDVVARFDGRGRFLYVSPSARTVLGRDPDGMLGKDCTGIIVDEDLAAIRETLKAYVAAGPDAPAPRYEYRVIMPEGGHIWVEATPRAIRDATGRVVEFHDCVRDITARKTLEREQSELVTTLKMAEAMASLGHWRLDVASQKVTWSEEVYRIHGVDPASFDPSYDDAVAFYHPDDRQKVRDWVGSAILTGASGEFRLKIIRADGEERHVTSQCVPQRDDSGATTALFGVFQDITDIVRSHEQVAASEARYRLLADNATDIIATYGIDGVFRYVSPAIEGPMGYRPEELTGRPFYEFMDPDDVARVQAAFLAYFKAGAGAESPRVAYRGMRKGGGTVWLEAHPKLICDAAGRPVEFQDVVRDISHTKQLEDELIKARDVAEAAAQAKSDFLANMSHELRTPLTGVIGFAGLLKASPNLAEAERRFADRIGTASEALLCVINDILDYSKLEADAVELDPQPFNARALADAAAGIVEGQAQAKGLALALDVSDALPEALIGDSGRLRQVMLNFLSNAVKFTASGGVTLSIGTSGERLRVAVADTGIGIPAEKIDQLFERFTQADASTTRQYGGTGLGLAISRRLIEMMGGEIGADSRPGEGSTFWFEIPMIVAEDAAGEGDLGDLTIPPGTRILMADDAAANRELVTAIMTSFDLTLDTVCDGAQAVEAARLGAYDLILMDVHMPVMDGLEATRMIRAMDGPAGRTSVVALTANVQPEHVQRCIEAGMDDHVGKPIQLTELMTAIARAVALSSTHTAVRAKKA